MGPKGKRIKARSLPEHSTAADHQNSIVRDSAGGRKGHQNDDKRTTLMLRNLPNDYNREVFLQFLDSEGHAGKYDFVYFPVDFKTGSGLGYAFVNFLSHGKAMHAWKSLNGYRAWCVPSVKVCDVCWSNPVQGFRANVDRYRNSPVMHEDVPEEFKPAVFSNGCRAPFPKPRKPSKRMPFQPLPQQPDADLQQ